MARKKNSKALFEILSQGVGSMEVPDWVKESPPAPQGETPEPTVEPPAEPPAKPPVAEETPAEVAPPSMDKQQPAEVAPLDNEQGLAEVDAEVVEVPPAEADAELPAEELGEVEEPEESGEPEEPEEVQAPAPADIVEDVEEPDEDIEDVEEAELEAEPIADVADGVEEDDIEEELDEDFGGNIVDDFAAEEVQTRADIDEQLASAIAEIDSEELVAEAMATVLAPETAAAPGQVTGGGDMVLGEPMLRVVGDRIYVSVNFVTAGVVGLVLLMLLLGAFVLGKKTAPSEAPTAPNQAGPVSQAQPEAPPATEPVAIADGPVEAKPGQRLASRYYLVIETLRGDKANDYDEAEKIIDFCSQRGLPAELVNIKGRFAVWCLLGYRSDRSSAALAHARKVERVGEEFFAKHKTYRFMQRQKKTGPLRPFFIAGTYKKR